MHDLFAAGTLIWLLQADVSELGGLALLFNTFYSTLCTSWPFSRSSNGNSRKVFYFSSLF